MDAREDLREKLNHTVIKADLDIAGLKKRRRRRF